MIRVVLDTNVIVSALLVPTGLEASVLLLGLQKHVELCVSTPILLEYEEVLQRPRLKLQRKEVAEVLANIQANGFLVHPTKTVRLSTHEPDNRIYECAGEANADYIVTGNKKHFPDDYKNAKVVNARELLERLRNS
jgi:putative PIN family toxin of toxin-antitoxin system